LDLLLDLENLVGLHLLQSMHHTWTYSPIGNMGTVVPPLVAARGCVPYLDRPLVYFQTPPSSDIKIARLRFLFVLRLRTGIDLRDQADIAPARLVTIGSWFSDSIGASSLARRSRIVRVNNHQIGFISTHRKIGHSPSIIRPLHRERWWQQRHKVPLLPFLSGPSST
jgi:hypothetical protein